MHTECLIELLITTLLIFSILALNYFLDGGDSILCSYVPASTWHQLLVFILLQACQYFIHFLSQEIDYWNKTVRRKKSIETVRSY